MTGLNSQTSDSIKPQSSDRLLPLGVRSRSFIPEQRRDMGWHHVFVHVNNSGSDGFGGAEPTALGFTVDWTLSGC